MTFSNLLKLTLGCSVLSLPYTYGMEKDFEERKATTKHKRQKPMDEDDYLVGAIRKKNKTRALSKEEAHGKRKVIALKDKDENSLDKIKSTQFALKNDIDLVKGKGSKETGGGDGGFFWKIFHQNESAGKVFINWIDEKPIGEHASIQIFLNKKSQGKHIGRIVYEMACKESGYKEVYAHMSKKNIPSYKAALAAGFQLYSDHPQRIMKWTRK